MMIRTNNSPVRAGDVKTYFERTASSFEHLYLDGNQNRAMRWLNRKLRSDIVQRFAATMEHVRQTNVQSVLDIGCGSGRYLEALVQNGVQRVVGIDVSAPMLELARSRLSDCSEDQVVLHHINFSDWETDERFDCLIAMGFFDYQDDPQAVLATMCRLTRHSVIASFPSRHWLRMPIRKIRYLLKRCPVHFFNPAQIETLARAAGFTRCDIRHTPGAKTSYLATFYLN